VDLCSSEYPLGQDLFPQYKPAMNSDAQR
jgi:hypothetical protein